MRSRACARSAGRCWWRPSPTASAATRWPTPSSTAAREEVERWRERDPLGVFARELIREGVIDEQQREQIDQEALARVDAAVEFADSSPFPAPESLYDDVYVLDGEVRGTYCVRSGGGPGGRRHRGRGRQRRLAAVAPPASPRRPPTTRSPSS